MLKSKLKTAFQSRELVVIPDKHIDRPTYLGLQKHLRINHPDKTYLTTYSAFESLNKTDAAQTLNMKFGSMILRVAGLSAEKAVGFVERWPTPASFYQDVCSHEINVKKENRQIEEEDANAGGKGKVKKRKMEKFVVESLPSDDPRRIKGKLAAKIWTLFTAEYKYEE